MRQGTFKWMKSYNKSIILNKVRTSEPISRAQIAKRTKLTPPTVSSIVKELIDQRIVIESESGESNGGRKPTMLHINNRAFYIVGVDAGSQGIECILADLSGNIIEHAFSSLDTPITNAQFLTILKKCIHTIFQKPSFDLAKVIGIGVSMHGVVDVDTGTSLVAPNLGLTDIPIKEELEREFNLTIKVENDARAMALGETWFGGHGDLDSMVTVNLGRGVGAGVIINGKLYHGAQDIAGEIGHMTIDINGKRCECGNRGCLQTFVTGSAIGERARGRIQNESVRLTGESVFELAKAGNDLYIDVLKETGSIIGIGLTNLIHIINPDQIVLGGGVMKSEKFILPAIRQEIKQRTLTTAASNTKVTVTKLGDDATILGAVSLLLVELFDPV